MELLLDEKITNFRRRPRKNPCPKPSPFNSIQDLYRFPPKDDIDDVEIEAPSSANLGKRKAAVSELEDSDSCPSNRREKTARAEKKQRARSPETRERSDDDVINGGSHNLPPRLAEKFMIKIRELGYEGEPTLVIQKRLYKSDVNENLHRLTIPESQVLSKELFSKLDWKLQQHKEGIDTILIDDKLTEWKIKFGKWKSNAQYALKSPWNEIVKENGLEVDKEIQVWSFMNNNKVYFVLVQ